MDFAQALRIVTEEVERTLARVNSGEMDTLAGAILKARRIAATGQGRSGLVARAFAMRLNHLGLSAQVVGESTATAIRRGDLLVAISCSGSTDVTCHMAKKAKAAGAAIACLTGRRRSRLWRMSDVAVLAPAPSKAEGRSPSKQARSRQFGSTLFEQCSLVLLDALCLVLMKRLRQTHSRMLSRHSNLE
ncbi:MAG: 6-phospho-3-hexuloisomerase [Planctomycetota bacterium]